MKSQYFHPFTVNRSATRSFASVVLLPLMLGGMFYSCLSVAATQQASAPIDSVATSVPLPIGDCDDTNFNVHPGAPEVVGNLIDDNCNGWADEAPDGTPSNNTSDFDGDGWTLANGDCNDTAGSVHPGGVELVGDRIDNNCNGIADEDAQGNPSTDTSDQDLDGLPMSNDRIFYAGFDK